MKKTVLFLLVALAIPAVAADAPEPPQGFVLTTKATAASESTKATWRSILGVPSLSGTDASVNNFTGTIKITGTGAGSGGLVLSGSTASPVAGSVMISGTEVKVYLTGSTGLIVKTGTVVAF